MNDKLAWYVSRSSGWVAFVLLAVTVVWGILGITKVVERKGLPRWMMDLHKYLALLSVMFTAVHLGALISDNFVHIEWREILVPYAFDWRPGAVSLGIAAFYLLIAVQVSSWLRPRLPRRVWKAAHMLSYPALWLVAMHGLRAGTDSSNVAVRIGVSVVIGLTSVLTLLRIVKGRTARRHPAQPPAAAPPAPGPCEVQEPDYLAHVNAAMDTLREALQTLHDASAASGPGSSVERRHEARTLVDDVSPAP